MREILFRGKRVDTGAWVEGFYDERYSYADKKFVSYIHVNDAPAEFEVDSNSVGQYTGLCDKKRLMIFEGDILRGFEYPYYSDGEDNYYGQVVWFINIPAFGICTYKVPNAKVRGISQGNSDYMEDWESSSWEVIGNIHDNPELLEVEK